MYRLLLCLLLVFSGSCAYKRNYKVGIAPSYFAARFEQEEALVLGYLQDLLLTISQKEHVSFEVVPNNQELLLEGLGKSYDIALSSLPSLNFTTARYDFSETVLKTGVVMVVKGKEKKLSDLKGKIIGILEGENLPEAITEDTHLTIRSYLALSSLFQALADDQIDGVLVERIEAMRYMGPLFPRFKILDAPLSHEGMRFVSLKGDQERAIRFINQAVHKLEKEGTLTALQKKWRLFL